MEFIKQPVNLRDMRTIASLVGTIMILLAIPLTVYVSQHQRKTRSRAAEPPAAKNIGLGGGGFEIDTLISNGRLLTTVECGGIRVSDDGGTTWKEASKGVPIYGNIQNLWKDPFNSNTIFVGMDGYILRSTNNGDSWTTVNTATSPIKRPFADFAAKDANTYFAVEGNRRAMYGGPAFNPFNTASSAKIWKSLDGGQTWSEGVQVAVSSTDNLPSIYLHPTTKDLYVATSTGGVRKSTDDGATWADYNEGLSDLTTHRLVADQADPNILYLTVEAQAGNPKIYKRDITAGNWTNITSDYLPSDSNLFDIAVSQTGKLYVANFNPNGGKGGIYRLDGTTWTHLTKYDVAKGSDGYMEKGWTSDWPSGVADWTRQPSGAAISIDPTDEKIMYFTTPLRDQHYKTENGGKSWYQIYTTLLSKEGVPAVDKLWTNRGMTLVGAHAIAVDPTNPNKILLGYGDWGTAVSTDGGNSWKRVMLELGFYADVNKILIDPENHLNIWHVAGYREPTTSKYGVYYSSNGGDNWSPIGGTAANLKGLNGGWVLDIAIDPTTTVGSRDVYIVAEGQGVYKQVNQSGNWIRIDGPGLPDTTSADWPLRTIAFDPGGGGRPKAIYVGFEKAGSGTGGVYKTTNSGSGWSSWSEVTAANGRSVSRGMYVNPNTGDLYFGTGNPQGGLYRFRYDNSTSERLIVDDKIQGLHLIAGPTREDDIVYISGQTNPLAKWNKDGLTSLMNRLPANVYARGHGVTYDAATDTLYASMQCSETYKIEDVNPNTSVDIKANGSDGPITVIYNTAATLTWSATNTEGDLPCTASNGWSGSKAATGSESTARLSANKTFTLTCNGLGGRTASDSVTVNVGKIGDMNGDTKVDFHDFSILVSRWGTNDQIADLNLDGVVNFHDFSTLVSHWGS